MTWLTLTSLVCYIMVRKSYNLDNMVIIFRNRRTFIRILALRVAQWINSSHIHLWLHSDILSRFRITHSLSLLRNRVWSREVPMLWYMVWPNRDSNPRSTILEANMLTITSHGLEIRKCNCILHFSVIVKFLFSSWEYFVQILWIKQSTNCKIQQDLMISLHLREQN